MKPFEAHETEVAAKTRVPRREGLVPAFRRFRSDEDGSLLIFGLFCFIIMLGLAGVALDLMRYEERRTTLQNTVDRAVLAAADLNQTLAPKEVVKDYFIKAGLTPPTDDEIDVQQGAMNEWRTVRTSVSENLPTWFMNMYGIEYIGTPASATAEERIGQVEISLVLDVSGSMDSNSRLINLKPAAKNFVTTMFDSVEDEKLSISVIPYAAQVSAGPGLLQYFNVTAEHSESDCIEFEEADFDTPAMDFGFGPTDRVYQRNGHFDPFTSSNTHNPYWEYRHCPQSSARDILAFSGDVDEINDFIDALDAHGNTSIDLGMKWGAAMLDPSMSGIVDDMVADGDVPGYFAERPYPYSNDEALKVVVIMSDGENTTEFQLKDTVKSGLSPVWRSNASTYNTSTSNAQYSVWNASRGQFYIFARSMWRNEPWGDGTYQTCKSTGVCTTNQDPGDAVQLTWQEVWSRMSLNWHARYIQGTANNDQSAWSSTGSKSVDRFDDEKDARTLAICSAFKNAAGTGGKRPQIYTIAFEAPSAGRTLLRNCASTTSQYYVADGSTIGGTFSAIASSINKLRLTY